MSQGAHDEFANSAPGNGHVEALVRDSFQNDNELSRLPLDDSTLSEIQSTTSHRARALHGPSYPDNEFSRTDVPDINVPIADEEHKRANNEAFCHNDSLLGSDLHGRALPPSESGLSELSFCSIEPVGDRGNAVHMEWEQTQSEEQNYHTPSGHSTSEPPAQGTPDIEMSRSNSSRVESPGSSNHVNGDTSEPANGSECANGVTAESADLLEDVESIKERICSSLVKSAFDEKDYLPLDQLCEILSPSVVHQVLIRHFDDVKVSEYQHEVLGTQNGAPLAPPRRRRIFAILILINQVKRLPKFIADGVDDRALPFHFTRIGHLAKGSTVSYMPHRQDEQCQGKAGSSKNPGRPNEKTFDVWPCRTAKDFMIWQSIIHVPFLKFPGDKIYFYDLHQDSTLPFGKYDLQETGGYGSVRKVTIHPSHYNPCGNSKKRQIVCFAVKKPHVPNVNDYLQEIDPFDKLGIENKESLSNHLIPLQLTFKHGRDYYLMFPWADGNLKQFWCRKNPKPEDSKAVCWFITQCSGVARGLRKIHHLSTQLSHKTVNAGNAKQMILGGKEWGRHGDIKPENILWFRDYDGKPDHLVISDFGLTQFNSAHSRSKVHQDQILGFSGTYRPPDLHLEGQSISQNYDVWSLGCVLLEFISWFLLGHDETVFTFVQARLNDEPEGAIQEDTFFVFENGLNRTPTKATLKKSVIEWINKLHAVTHCSEPLHALLDLIHFTMLVPDPKKRWKCSWIDSKLRQLESQCKQGTIDTMGTPGSPDSTRYLDPPEEAQTAKLLSKLQSQELANIHLSPDETKEATPPSLGSRSNRRRVKSQKPPFTGARDPIQEESSEEIPPDPPQDTLDELYESRTSRTSSVSPSTRDRTVHRPQSAGISLIRPVLTPDSMEHQLDGYGSQFDNIPQEAFGELPDDDDLNETATNDTNPQNSVDGLLQLRPGNGEFSRQTSQPNSETESSVSAEPLGVSQHSVADATHMATDLPSRWQRVKRRLKNWWRMILCR